MKQGVQCVTTRIWGDGGIAEVRFPSDGIITTIGVG
jgi:hypothetical protein